jgi:imidazolonepropionase
MSRLWRNASLASFSPAIGSADGWGWLEKASIVVGDGTIQWAGLLANMPAQLRASITEETDVQGALITPGLVDCHTHLVYAGARAREFELRLEGASYEEIARSGGGIRSTVNATRLATQDELLALAITRAQVLMREGVSTLEIKSGYGLSLESEANCLRVARQVGKQLGIQVRTTFLGAHALPPEFTDRSDDYIDAVNSWMKPLHTQRLIDAVDVFCEGIGFSPAQTRKVFDAAHALGLPVKLHAEQLSDLGGAQLAAQYQALSCDHLEYVSDAGVAAMAASGTVAVLLPAAFYFLRESRVPPIASLREHRVPIALATDHNPGSSPILSPLLVMNMACTLFRMTVLEAWQGFTVHAAKALGLTEQCGQIQAGTRADLAIWNAEHPRDLVYPVGTSAIGSGQSLRKLVLANSHHDHTV